MKKVRVLVVEDSAVVREILVRMISADPRLEVAGAVASAEEALALLDRIAPDVISLDIRLPGMQGIEATRRIMSRRPTPIVVLSENSGGEEANLGMEALKSGALSIVEKPVGRAHPDYEALAGHLCTQLAIMSEVHVIRQRPELRLDRAGAPPSCVSQPGHYKVLGIAASTGGPNALLEVLCGLGRDFPLPILIVQHMTPKFMAGFGAWLREAAPFHVEMVNGKRPLVAGTAYLAEPERHLFADAHWVWSGDSHERHHHRPSGSVLFSSIARHLRERGIGVLLTGMGDDGASGLLELRRSGGYTIAEDESTAVIYGMPGAGVKLGAVCESLPLPQIARRVLELTAVPQEFL